MAENLSRRELKLAQHSIPVTMKGMIVYQAKWREYAYAEEW